MVFISMWLWRGVIKHIWIEAFLLAVLLLTWTDLSTDYQDKGLSSLFQLLRSESDSMSRRMEEFRCEGMYVCPDESCKLWSRLHGSFSCPCMLPAKPHHAPSTARRRRRRWPGWSSLRAMHRRPRLSGSLDAWVASLTSTITLACPAR